MATVKDYFSLVKFSHTIFALPFALIGFFLGFRETRYFHDAPFFIQMFLAVLGCMVTARAAAMAFNRYLDRRWDAMNPRTQIREIPAGKISASAALIFTTIMCVLFIACTFLINRICFYLSPVALFVVLFYSYTKRFTFLCHLVLGVGLSLAPIGAYLAVTAYFSLVPILFSLTVLFWVSGFDIIYALQDEEFDKANRLYSVPAFFGKVKGLNISSALHLLSASALIAAGFYGDFGFWFWIGAFIFCSMLMYQHSLVKPNDLSKVNIAFMTANGIASVVFAVFVITDILI